ncbi:hypothetical protein B5807_07518 [Epicoccum nigrum]|uniref:Uncharacterized protein n=1 Tax=Epicoccum nigrum TaxID=105696 RepID=A0A1Y2LUQ7_EPING|nr:hypothetical protein B5807_07518 [Epicoccum nigrum]
MKLWWCGRIASHRIAWRECCGRYRFFSFRCHKSSAEIPTSAMLYAIQCHAMPCHATPCACKYVLQGLSHRACQPSQPRPSKTPFPSHPSPTAQSVLPPSPFRLLSLSTRLKSCREELSNRCALALDSMAAEWRLVLLSALGIPGTLSSSLARPLSSSPSPTSNTSSCNSIKSPNPPPVAPTPGTTFCRPPGVPGSASSFCAWEPTLRTQPSMAPPISWKLMSAPDGVTTPEPGPRVPSASSREGAQGVKYSWPGGGAMLGRWAANILFRPSWAGPGLRTLRPRVPTPPGPESHGFGGGCWPEVLRWRLCAEREERLLDARGRVGWEGELVRVLGAMEAEERGRSTDARGVEVASE